MKPSFIVTLVCLIILISGFTSAFCLPWPPELDVVYIKFNYTSGYSYDALTIKRNNSTQIQVPEWYPAYSRNEPMAYIKSQSDCIIEAKFWIDRSGFSDAGIYADMSGQGIGDVPVQWVDFNETQYSTQPMECSGSVPSSVGIRSFSWDWYVTYIDDYEFEEPLWIGDTGDHEYYTLLAAPQAPMSVPWTDVLDYSCDWASGTTTSSSACTAILSNGFSAHYTWGEGGNCHRLSSDFVRLVTCIGISASQHRWSSKNQNVGDMSYQRTKSIDPVGPTYGQGAQQWYFHQWSEAASSQRDPSTATSKSGSWGGYEDDLFTHYERKIASYPYYERVSNQSGQSSGCEAPEHRIYSSSPPLYDWRGPDR